MTAAAIDASTTDAVVTLLVAVIGLAQAALVFAGRRRARQLDDVRRQIGVDRREGD